MSGKNTRPGQRPDKRPRGVQGGGEKKSSRTLPTKGGFMCVECGVVQLEGRWAFGVLAPVEAKEGLCPACKRIHEKDPAGTIRTHHVDASLHEELRHLIANVETAEREDHPLERLMAIEPEDGGLVVTTTGIHLARRVANALERRLHRQARFTYSDGEQRLVAEFETEPAA